MGKPKTVATDFTNLHELTKRINENLRNPWLKLLADHARPARSRRA
jgi:hypothetical protein